MRGVEAALTCPEDLEKRGDDVIYQGKRVTVIFLDMNTDILLKTGARYAIEPLLAGIRRGIVVNPRGLEPLGSKGIFEAVTGEIGSRLSPSTVTFTPWTRLFHDRATTGPHGESIPDLVEWVRGHWNKIILKPIHGYSGRGIIVGPQSESRDDDIQRVLKGEPYIVQAFIPKGLWAEEYPWLDIQREELVLRQAGYPVQECDDANVPDTSRNRRATGCCWHSRRRVSRGRQFEHVSGRQRSSFPRDHGAYT